MKKTKAKITEQEESLIRDLCYRGKRGTLDSSEISKVTDLYNRFPKEYAKIGEEVNETVMAEMNPMYRKKNKA